MALLGMGANMQYNGNFPGYYSRINLNMEANSSTWPVNDIDKVFDHGPFYNGFLPSFPPDQVLGYQKEVLKQEMLKHETIFRDQIHELHRLYSRQRALMDEMRRNELYKHELRLETSKSNSVLSHVSSEYAQNTCHATHAPSLPWVNPACGGLSVSGAENVQFPLSSIQGKSTQACPDPAQTEECFKDFELLESKCKKIGKKVLDLQLPAYVYVDSEEEESLEDGKVTKVLDLSSYTSKGITQVVCNGDVNPFHGSNELKDVFCEEASTSVLKKSTALADLNEPVKFEEEAASKSDFVGPTSCRESPCLDVSQKTKSTFQISSEEIIQNTCTRWDFESRSDVVLSEKKERKQEWPSFSDEAGFVAENLSMLPESSKEELQQAHQPPTFHLLTKSYQEVETKRTIFSVESFGRDHGSLNDSQPGPSSASYMCTSRELVPHADVAISGSSPAASCRKPVRDMVRNPIAVQALPCFNTSVSLGSSKSSIGRPGLTGDISHSVQDSFCNSYQSEPKRFRVHPPSFSFDNVNNDNNHELTSEHQGLSNYVQGSMDMKSSKSINLNFMPNCCSSDVEVSQSIQGTDGMEKLEKLTGVLALLKVKQVLDGRPEKGSEDSTQVESVLLKAYTECIPDVDPKKFEASDSPSNRRILNFPTYEKPHISSDQCSSHASQSETHQNGDEYIENTQKDVLDINLTCDSVPDSGKCPTASELVLENGLDKKHEGFGSHIDLNSCINEDESSPMHSLSTEVDLQAPASPENKECSPPRGESNETLLETPSQSSRQEDADLLGELMRIAAEAIISISSSEVQICIEKTTCKTSEAPSSDSLHWFAGIVSSVEGEPENESGKVLSSKYSNHDDDEFLPDGIDYFEAMTLRLTETKEEECCCKCNIQKEEERGAILLQSQPRKGRTRRGRQRKDFQSEILPSLASLSRYEVTEDLQTIGGLMEAAGSRWETGSLRNAGRIGSTRGRRRSCAPSSSVAENTVGSLLKQQTANSEKGIEERNLIGWGKITRRRRGQRHPVSNPQLILGQV
ncbi:uncharacterized protein LOC142631649 isoform X1 [Castanea sativa]|uniref:uncharacterized protein LOC142631649 isoform X1 n=1 Tax=Castanea sativa TaxID=21020 RepID=UPI003F64BF8B